MVVIGPHDDQRIGGNWQEWRDQLKTNIAGMMRPIKDEHSRVDNVTPVMNPDNAHVIDGHKVAIHYLQ